jgi:hypothetical protein
MEDTVTAQSKPTDECPAGDIEVRGGVTPYLNVDGAGKAAEFYVRAFGATEMARMPPDDKGRYMHIHLYVNGGSLMLADFFPEHGHPQVKPQAFDLHLRSMTLIPYGIVPSKPVPRSCIRSSACSGGIAMVCSAIPSVCAGRSPR